MLNRLFQNMPGIEIYGIIVLLIMLIVFVLIVVRVWRADRRHLKRMSELPLEDTLNRGEEIHDRKL